PDYHQCLDYAQNGRSTHDLAVLQLPQAVNAFPPVSLTSSAPVVGSLAWAIGYGLPNYDPRRGAFQITSVGSDGVMGAPGVGADVCGADSGGPLFASATDCSGTPPPVLIGMISGANLDATGCSLDHSAWFAPVASQDNAAFIQGVVNGSTA